MSYIAELNQALELISKPTAKRLRIAANILLKVVYSERKGFCTPSTFKWFRFEQTIQQDGPRFKLKKYICAICPSCGSKTFDLNTEIMQGSCLSCGLKSSNYKYDMINRGINLKIK